MAKPMSEVDASSNGLSSLINNLITFKISMNTGSHFGNHFMSKSAS